MRQKGTERTLSARKHASDRPTGRPANYRVYTRRAYRAPSSRFGHPKVAPFFAKTKSAAVGQRRSCTFAALPAGARLRMRRRGGGGGLALLRGDLENARPRAKPSRRAVTAAFLLNQTYPLKGKKKSGEKNIIARERKKEVLSASTQRSRPKWRRLADRVTVDRAVCLPTERTREPYRLTGSRLTD